MPNGSEQTCEHPVPGRHSAVMKRAFATIGVTVLLSAATAGTASASLTDFQGMRKAQKVAVSLGTYLTETVAGESKWGWLDGVPTTSFTPNYTPNFYGYSVDLMSKVTDPETVTRRSTDLLLYSGVSDGGKKAAWLLNT